MTPRLFIDPAPAPLPPTATVPAAAIALPAGAARHVQVLRLQPGSPVVLFDGTGGEWRARVVAIGRREVTVALEAKVEVDRELGIAVTLAVGMPANERMDALVEKATELGVAVLQPLVCERSVLRPDAGRAAKKLAHWQAVAHAASEQCGRTVPPRVAPILGWAAWLAGLELPQPADDPRAAAPALRWLLDPGDAGALPSSVEPAPASVLLASGPEGGLSDAEVAAARRSGFTPVSLGPRVLRADTAPIAALARIGGWQEQGRRSSAAVSARNAA